MLAGTWGRGIERLSFFDRGDVLVQLDPAVHAASSLMLFIAHWHHPGNRPVSPIVCILVFFFTSCQLAIHTRLSAVQFRIFSSLFNTHLQAKTTSPFYSHVLAPYLSPD